MATKGIYQKAMKLMEEGRPTDATQQLIAYLKNEPNDLDAWWLVARAARDEHRARKALEHMLGIDPNDKRALKMLKLLDHKTFKPLPEIKPKVEKKKKAKSKEGSGSFGFIIMGIGVLVLVLAVGIIFVDALTSGPRDTVEGVVNDMFWALQNEDLIKYREMLHPENPTLAYANNVYTPIFKFTDIEYRVTSLEMTDYGDTVAHVDYTVEMNVKFVDPKANMTLPSTVISGTIELWYDDELGWKVYWDSNDGLVY